MVPVVPRDRSLVTVAALIATGQVVQITFHLNKAMDNGLTAEQAEEILTHLAFYAGQAPPWQRRRTESDVAEVVWRAPNDVSDQLRFPLGGRCGALDAQSR